MPPGPLYNWLCVLASARDILTHAATIRAAQAARVKANVQGGLGLDRSVRASRAVGRYEAGEDRKDAEEIISISKNDEQEIGVASPEEQNSTGEKQRAERLDEYIASTAPAFQRRILDTVNASAFALERTEVKDGLNSLSPTSRRVSSEEQFKSDTKFVPEVPESVSSADESKLVLADQRSTKESIQELPSTGVQLDAPITSLPSPRRSLQASRVPSSRVGRFLHYGGLAASLGYGAASEALRRVSSSHSAEGQTSLMMSSGNISRLVEKLSKMRGAALKLGQFMSIQDSHVLPKDVEEVFRRVQDSAHYMPNWQMEQVMTNSLGPAWSSNFTSFNPIPFAAASLGQVHSAVLAAHASPTAKDEKVAVKVQFPDIARSIESDLGYLKLLLTAGKMLPRGLFLDKTISVMKGELADECDYSREAECARFFASEEGLGGDSRFRVPWIWDECTKEVLVMQHMDGVSVGGSVMDELNQEVRDEIASRIIELCMKELFALRMMQTDPNWTNFLWNERSRQIELIDFGATRSYSKEFIDKWMHILQAAVSEDKDECIRWSLELGYLTGEESETMLDAHVRSLTLLATPFRAHNSRGHDGRYAFGKGTEWARITAEIRSLIPVMLRERLTPPPRETYSLNRKLSGAFLLASRLGARVDCAGIWEKTVANYR